MKPRPHGSFARALSRIRHGLGGGPALVSKWCDPDADVNQAHGLTSPRKREGLEIIERRQFQTMRLQRSIERVADQP